MTRFRNTIPPYKMISIEILERSQIEILRPNLKYFNGEEDKEIDIDDEKINDISVHKYDPEWDPDKNNLIIEQTFIFKNPKVFFGENGVTSLDNSIGMLAHIHSKTSSFQKKVKVGSFKARSETVKLQFKQEFPSGSLRGELIIEFYLYLDEIKDSLPLHASQRGMKLTNGSLLQLALIVDGIGSSFPIIEFQDKDGPLWYVEKLWEDPLEESFDASNVRLMLNTSHSEFVKLKDGRNKINRLYMADIMVQVIAMVINDVINNSEYSLIDVEDSVPGSIMQVVKYWIETFDVNTNDMFTIVNSLKNALSHDFLESR